MSVEHLYKQFNDAEIYIFEQILLGKVGLDLVAEGYESNEVTNALKKAYKVTAVDVDYSGCENSGSKKIAFLNFCRKEGLFCKKEEPSDAFQSISPAIFDKSLECSFNECDKREPIPEFAKEKVEEIREGIEKRKNNKLKSILFEAIDNHIGISSEVLQQRKLEIADKILDEKFFSDIFVANELKNSELYQETQKMSASLNILVELKAHIDDVLGGANV